MIIIDPYLEILKHMRTQGAKYNTPEMQLGEMINSITLKIGDLQVTKDDLLIADYLINGYTREFSVNGSINTYKAETGLKSGDIVATMPINDGQKYIILAKVVKV